MIHKTAIVETKNIGKDCRIWAFVHILPNAKIGNNANICDHCFIENDVDIGDNVTIKSGVYIWDGATIGNDVFIGPNVSFTNDVYPRSKNINYLQKKIYLKNGCSIGANSTLLPGISIGKYAMIGAGSVVTKNVDDFVIVLGNPAKKKGYVCSCGAKLKIIRDKSVCVCGNKFIMSNSKLIIDYEDTLS